MHATPFLLASVRVAVKNIYIFTAQALLPLQARSVKFLYNFLAALLRTNRGSGKVKK